MEGELFYDRIVCYIEPSIEELDAMCNIMNQTRSKYKIMVCSNNVYKYNYETRDRLEFVNIKSKGNIEYKAMKFCFNNYFSSSYFLIRNEDSLYNFKYLIAYSLKNKKEFIIVNEDKRYYDKLFDKMYMLENNKFTVGSYYLFCSYRFLKLLFSEYKKPKDFTQSAIKLCLRYPEIESNCIYLRGPLSKVNEWLITKMKLKIFLTNNFFIGFMLSLPALIKIIYLDNFNVLTISTITFNFLLISTLTYIFKKVYYNEIYKGGNDSNEHD